MSEKPDLLTLEKCLSECAKNAELVANYNRLTGSNFTTAVERSRLDAMIDAACGNPSGVTVAMHAEAKKFFAFCIECVWQPMLDGRAVAAASR